MCVIYACNSSLPTDDELRRGSNTNEDGAGVAWLTKITNDKGKEVDVIKWKKGLKDDKAVKEFIKDSKLGFPLAIHFRTASVGGVDPELCHPFPLWEGAPLWKEGHADKVLFHNGHLSSWEELVLKVGIPSQEEFPEGNWSDSRALAWAVWLKGEGLLPFIIGQSRVLVFHSEPRSFLDQPYNKEEDHFTFYGPGWIHKNNGWSQSVDTYDRYSRTPGRWANHREYVFDDATGEIIESEEDTLPACRVVGLGEGVRTLGPGSSGGGSSSAGTPPALPSGISTSYSETINIWTISELKSFLKEIEEEQNRASLAAGVS